MNNCLMINIVYDQRIPTDFVMADGLPFLKTNNILLKHNLYINIIENSFIYL